MHHANLPMEMRYHSFGEIFTTVMLLDGLTVIELSGKCANRYEHFFGETPKFTCCLCTVGEVGTLKIKTDTTPKLEDHGIHCLFVGNSLSHPSRCYQMYDSMCRCHAMWWGYITCFIKKLKHSQELNTDPTTVGNWTRNLQGVLRFIKVGEGVSEDPVAENAEIAEDHEIH